MNRQPQMAGVQHQIAKSGLHGVGAEFLESVARDPRRLLDETGALDVLEPGTARRQKRSARLESALLLDRRHGVPAARPGDHLLDGAAFGREERLLLDD